MFTGLIQDIGEILAIDKNGDWAVTIAAPKLALDKTALGASIACNGICLTVIEKTARQFKVQLSQESVSHTTAQNWQAGTKINLEPALRMGDELGGHFVTGHIDGVAKLIDKRASGDSVILQFELPPEFTSFIAPKGSVALNGASLTVNGVDKNRFDVNIIPHTLKETTLGSLKAGDSVNFEIDPLARYIRRALQ